MIIMKKIFSIFLLSLLPCVCKSQRYQSAEDVRSSHLKCSSISAMVGAHDVFSSDYSRSTYGVAATFEHFYCDVLVGYSSSRFAEKKKIYPNKVENWSCHAGYRFPVRRFGVAPVVGISESSLGYVIGKDLADEQSLFNPYHKQSEDVNFDYGLACDYHFPYSPNCKVTLLATRYNICFGLGYCF